MKVLKKEGKGGREGSFPMDPVSGERDKGSCKLKGEIIQGGGGLSGAKKDENDSVA